MYLCTEIKTVGRDKQAERAKEMNNEQQDKALFVSFCIEQYAKAKNMNTEDVVNLFERYGRTFLQVL